MQINFGNVHVATPQLPPSAAGLRPLVAYDATLPAGPVSILAQVQLHARTAAADVRIHVAPLAGGTGVATGGRRLERGPDDRVLLHALIPEPDGYRIVVEVEEVAEPPLLRLLTVTDGHAPDSRDAAFDFDPVSAEDLTKLSCVILGTTTRCPASCINCPTNKPVTADVPKGVMSMPLFQSIVDGLAELGYAGSIVFGLYGEPMLDPHLKERLAYIRARLPSASPLIATTGSVYEPSRHDGALEHSCAIAVHVESIRPDVYDRRMDPLRHHRAMPRIRQLLSKLGQRAHLSVPLNRENFGDIPEMLRMSLDLGAALPDFSALSNRCGHNTVFEQESLAPAAACCSPAKVASDLVIDWDGTVVACCFDFLRQGKLGSVADGDVKAFLESEARLAALERFRRKDWASMPACRNCRIDDPQAVTRMVQEVTTQEMRVICIPALAFNRREDVAADHGSLILNHPQAFEPEAAIRVWGPYWRVPPGRYRIDLNAAFTGWEQQSFAVVELLKTCQVVDTIRLSGPMDVVGGVGFETDAEGTELLEVRIATRNLGFQMDGAVLYRV
ncbi:radical SAM/SPASM domain-containing protein [Belnapia sp. F-4-1]|uniref:radical SAM/SPASM domain-containing protein n=1 Tax=Belnapia sp. F-4-1 TaxID=1545443 RepID=UPI001364D4AE|nr:radical SAM/SPASM domain-containing protein [Belnapia sp. F-4-1]